MPSHSSPNFLKIIVLDFSLAIVGEVLDSFNKINLLDYLDKCYKILKEEREEYLNTIPVICSGHLIRAIKRFTENAVLCCKNKTLKNFCMKIMGRLIMMKQFEILDRLGRSTLVVLTTKYISKDYLNHLHTVEKAINNFNFEPLDEKLTDEDEIDFHKPDIQDNISTVEEKLVQQSKFFKYWNVAEKNEESDASINKNDEYVTANQFYFPEFANKLRNWYLPTCPLWSRLMTSIIKNKEAAAISKDIIVRNITEEINTNAQAEECFRIKKYSSFKEKDVSICEFIKRNYEDNIALQRETVDACLHEISKRKNSARKMESK